LEKVPQKLDKTRKKYYKDSPIAKLGERKPDFSTMDRKIKNPFAKRIIDLLKPFFPVAVKRIARLAALENLTYAADGFVTSHHVEFLNNDRFNYSYRGALKDVPELLRGTEIEWRAHICCWAASQAIHLEGDFIECGVWYGILSKTICEYIEFSSQNRNFYLVDSWGKMPGSHAGANYQEDIYDIVKKRFAKWPNVSLIRGLVPEALFRIPSQKVAYLSIDMNGSEPEKAALEYFYEKIVPGGVIYFDDYGWGYPELRYVVNEFFADKKESLLHFPSGNSIVVKL